MSDNWVVQNLQNALDTWNKYLSEIWQLITQSPEQFKGGTIWGVIVNIHDAVRAIGLALLVLFFVVGVMRTCGSFAEVKKPEHALKLFIRFAIAKGVVTYGLELMMALFNIVQGLVSTIMNAAGFGTAQQTVLPQEIVTAVESCGFFESIPLWAVTLIGGLFITVLSFIMIMTVYGRFFKLYLYTAIAPVPLSTFAGEPTQNVGKSFMLHPDYANDDILICDPEGEFGALVKALGREKATVAHLVAGGKDRLNAMYMVEGYGEQNPIVEKSQFVMSLIEQIDKRGVGPQHKSIIDRCTALVYPEAEKIGRVATLCDLRQKLLEQPEDKAREIALSLELYTTGSLDIFGRESTVDLNKPYVVFDIHGLGEQLKPAGSLVITDTILNRVTLNWKRGKRTHVFIDEFHVMFENEQSGIFFNSAWRQFRKRGAYPTAITQNVEYLLDSVQASTMDDSKKAILTDIFWEMNQISSRTETRTETVITETDDGNGNIVETETTVTQTYLYITVSHKTAEEMAAQYGFDEEQKEQLAELLTEENRSLWSAVLYGIYTEDGAIVSVALSQVGNVGGEPYWSWYGFSGRVEWCACFVSWCANECGYIDTGVIPKYAGCVNGVQWFKDRGQWLDNSAEPAPGMIIFFDWDDENGQDGLSDHTGIVEKVENGRVYTIEGNSGDSVRQNSYPVGHYEVLGYGILCP